MTMKWNIKLVMENLIGGLTARYLLPTGMCSNFFSHRTKILKFYCLPTLAHLPQPYKPTQGQSQKSQIFHPAKTTEINSIFVATFAKKHLGE